VVVVMLVEEIQTPQHQALVEDMVVVREQILLVHLGMVVMPLLTPEVVVVEVVELSAVVLILVVMVDQVSLLLGM
tara:strand:+ start:302 stop:526 length:225 start_codon:yes stop_codon:yes gene_type:complete